jgi:hypothetical protein
MLLIQNRVDLGISLIARYIGQIVMLDLSEMEIPSVLIIKESIISYSLSIQFSSSFFVKFLYINPFTTSLISFEK